jgi:hypothetical protein
MDSHYLTLSWNDIIPEKANKIVKTLRLNPTICHLDFRSNNNAKLENIIELCNILSVNPSVRFLNLRGLSINTSAAIEFSKLFSKNNVLINICLACTNLDLANTIMIVKALAHNVNLNTLYLSGNNIDPNGQFKFLRCWKNFPICNDYI